MIQIIFSFCLEQRLKKKSFLDEKFLKNCNKDVANDLSDGDQKSDGYYVKKSWNIEEKKWKENKRCFFELR